MLCFCVLSTSPKHMAPSTEPFSGLSLLPPKMLACIRQFHDGTQACVRLEGGECPDKFDVGQCLRQGSVLAPLLFNTFSTAVRNASLLMRPSWATWCSSNETRRRGRRRANHERSKSMGEGGKEEKGEQGLWGMLYVDKAGIVSQSPGGSWRRMMTVIATACSAFGLTVPEANTDEMRLHTKDEWSRCPSPSLQLVRNTNKRLNLCASGRGY